MDERDMADIEIQGVDWYFGKPEEDEETTEDHDI